MKLYAVKNDDGEYWDYINGDWSTVSNGDYTSGKSYAEDTVDFRGGHVVPLVEKPEPVEVSEEEAEMLEKAKDTDVWRPAAVISDYAYNAAKDSDQEALLEERLIRAYVNGWTVEKPKLWYVKVPGEFHGGERHYWKTGVDRDVETAKLISTDSRFKFTDAEIEHYGLQDCEKDEVRAVGVLKPKRYVLPMEGTEDEDGDFQYAKHYEDGTWLACGEYNRKYAVEHASVTQADIDAAPDWVRALKPVEVTDNE